MRVFIAQHFEEDNNDLQDQVNSRYIDNQAQT